MFALFHWLEDVVLRGALATLVCGVIVIFSILLWHWLTRLQRRSGVKQRTFFEGKRVVITGASMGIGAEVARQLAPRGCRLVLAARKRLDLEQVAQECKSLSPRKDRERSVLIVPMDVTVENDCRRLVEATVDAFGGVDVLILNAGISMHQKFENLEDFGTLRQLMEVNYFGPAMLTRLFLPFVKKSKGTIALVSSMASQFCPPYRSGYAASKAAIDSLMDVLRIELGSESNVHIVKLFPGFVDTNIRNHAIGAQEDVNYDGKRMMSVNTAADRILYAVAIGKRNELFDLFAGTLAVIRLIFPSLADRIVSSAVSKAKKALKKED